jgi:predicted ABC-type ATPase
MDYTKPTLLVISGPNGAGKSTYINFMLPQEFEGLQSFDRDKTRSEFERQLRMEDFDPELLQAKAMRMMEKELIQAMDDAIAAQRHFVLETPLSHSDYWKYIDRFERNGYQVQLNYLCLDKVSDCKARVQQRVMGGGHFVDARTIKGVYDTNLRFINDFKDTFKVIGLYDGMKIPTLLVMTEGNDVIMANDNALRKKWIKSGLPAIAKMISLFLETQKGGIKKG